LSPDYSSALKAAHDAASNQHYPQGALYVVATPIGNLADITLRALHVLAIADTIACEDTRHTQAMLRAYGIAKEASQLLAVHQHNEAQASLTVIERLAQGQRVAYVSDAGTPGVSDPGARLVSAVSQAAMRVMPVPGTSSVTAVISAAGVAGDGAAHGQFVFGGFLSSKSAERTASVMALADETRTVVLLEAPHRIEALMGSLASLGGRQVTVGRELTKQFEEIATMPAQELPAWLAQDPNRMRGEFVLALHPAVANTATDKDSRVLKLLMEHLPLKTAVKLASDITGEPRNAIYETALELKQAAPGN